jgi:type IV secretory pathway VirB3-like protein
MNGTTKNLIGLALEVLAFAFLPTAIVSAIEQPFIAICILVGAMLLFTARLMRDTLELSKPN